MDANHYQPRHALHQGKFVNDGFFPDLDLTVLQKRYRIDSSITLEALYGLVLAAVMLTNRGLYDWACAKVKTTGANTLAEVPAPHYGFQPPPPAPDGQPIPSLHYASLYEHAIFARVKGDLSRENSHHTMGKEGIQRQMSYRDLSADYYRQSVWAVRQIKGTHTTRVRLL